jgi:hypothetical protein
MVNGDVAKEMKPDTVDGTELPPTNGTEDDGHESGDEAAQYSGAETESEVSNKSADLPSPPSSLEKPRAPSASSFRSKK